MITKRKIRGLVGTYFISRLYCLTTFGPAFVALLDAHPTVDQDFVGSTPRGQQHSFREIDHEIFSTVILSLPLIHEGQLSVSTQTRL